MNDLIINNPELPVYDEAEHKYTIETVQCVMILTDMKVPTKQNGNVMKEVAKLCGININRVPSASTVNRNVDSKVALSETQVGSAFYTRTCLTSCARRTSSPHLNLVLFPTTQLSTNSFLVTIHSVWLLTAERKSAQCSVIFLKPSI